MSCRSPLRGYSLFELLVTLAVAALVLGLGLPSFAHLAADKRLRAETDALFHAVHLARKRSVARHRVVTICPSVDGAFCDTENRWSNGWIVFENAGVSSTGHRSAEEKLLDFHPIESNVDIRSNRRSFAFRATHLRATNGTIVVCDPQGRAASRALVVSYTGRPRVARSDRRGRPYTCAD